LSEKLKISLKANFSLFEEMKLQKLVVFTNLGNTSSPDILRVHVFWPFYRYPWISQIFQRFKSTDLLEISMVL